MAKRTKAEWEELLEDYQMSRMTQKEWSRKNGVNLGTLRNKLKKKNYNLDSEEDTDVMPSQTVNWIEVQTEIEETAEISAKKISTKLIEPDEPVETDIGSAASAISVVIGKIHINVRAGFDEAVLKSVCKAVMTI